MKPRLLITGASGFIGGYLVDEALARGYDVTVAIRPSSDRSRLSNPAIIFIELNYSSAELVAKYADGLAPSADEPAWHYVIHNAGITKSKDAADFMRINAEQTRHLVEGLALAKAKPKRFVLMSSMGSYGPLLDEWAVLDESCTQMPVTNYGRSKYLAEQYVKKSGLPYSIMQPTGVYGPYDRDYLLTYMAVSKGLDFATGSKPQQLSFVYASDLAQAAFVAMESAEAANRSFIVSDGQTISDVDYGQMLQRLIGKKRVWSVRVPLPLLRVACEAGQLWANLTGKITALNSDKYAILAQRNWRCDPSAIMALGFVPKYSLEQGLMASIRWARQEGYLV